MNDSRPRLPQMLAAEFIGTFALIFFGPGAGVVNAQTQALGHWGVAIVFGLVVAAAVTTLGPISGAHINPVATLALWISRRSACGSDSAMCCATSK